jgi:hypothetical protein
MKHRDEPPDEIDRLLTDAWIPAINGEVSSAAQRLERARRFGAPERALATHAAVAPAHSACEPEQAHRELDLTVALILDVPHAPAMLSSLIDQQRFEPEGAAVFACLLYLAARDEQARGWWQLAAGAGSRNAAFCLCLHHRRYGEYRDAQHWRHQAAGLRTHASAHPVPTHPDSHPLLPKNLGKDLIAKCHRGERPGLPRSIEADIRRFTVEGADAHFDEIPRLTPRRA